MLDCLRAEVLRIGSFRFHFYSDERQEPAHIHVRTPDGEQRLVPGDVAVFSEGPEGAHSVSGPGRVVMMSTKIDPSASEYPDSNKIGIWPPNKLFRLDDAVDYFDGEA